MKKILTVFLPVILSLSISITVTAKGNDTYLSEEIQGYCVEIGEEYGICPELLMAIIEKESSGNSLAENGDCKGLMQISERWHRDRMDRLGVENIYDSYGNILVGTDYLMELAEEYGDISYVLDIYNGNSKAERNYQNGVLSDYSEKILERSEELERLHGK